MKLRGLRVALYARRSKEEHQAASIDVQTGEARAFIDREGGSLAPEHVFVDSDHGRAEFKKRPALIALLNAAAKHAFEAVVVRDESRLGGDTNRTSLFIQDLLDHGVRLFYYFTGEEVTIEGAVDRFMINVRNFASELEREKISQRTHEHLKTKARKGVNVGGRCYGYDNLEVLDGERRVRVEYRVNEQQAAIIREIFTRYANGEGLRTIAKDLNARGLVPPRVGKRGTGSWTYTAIYEIVRRERYRGVLVWGKWEKTYRGGTKVRVVRPESERVTLAVPELRIVDEALWAAVQGKVNRTRKPSGVQTKGPPSRYLLTGLARCGVCGGPITVGHVKRSYANVPAYICAWHKNRGAAACANSLRRPVADVDAATLAWIRANVLQEEQMLETLRELRRRLAARGREAREGAPELEKEARTLRAELARLGEALLASDRPPHTVLQMIGERETRLAQLDARLASIATAPEVLDLEARRMEREAKARLTDFGALLSRRPEDARKVLEGLIGEPITFTPIALPEGQRYQVNGTIALERLFLVEGVPSGTPSTRNRESVRVPMSYAA